MAKLINRIAARLRGVLTILLMSTVMISILVGGKLVTESGEPIKVIAGSGVDFSDRRKLAGRSDNIFVGTVVGNGVVDRDSRGGVYALFPVQVDENIKGNLTGTVTVRQAGGYDARYGTVQIVNGDPLLKSGETYVFVTIADIARDVYTTFSGHGNIHVVSPEARSRLISEFEEAVRNQIEGPLFSDQ